MKITKLLSTTLIALFCYTVSAQDPDRKNSLGIYQVMTDHNVELLNNKVFVFDSALSQSIRLGYQRLMSRSWMVNAGLSNGFIQNQSFEDQFIRKAYIVGLDASIIYKTNNDVFFKRDARVAPYLGFGYRIDRVSGLRKLSVDPWLIHNQYALGFNIKLNSRTHLQLQAAIDQKLHDDFNTNMRYRFGLTQSIGALDNTLKSPKLKDSDGDGIADIEDACPKVAGLLANNGCPEATVNDEVVVEDKPLEKPNSNSDSLLNVISNLKKEVDSLTAANESSLALLDAKILEITALQDSLNACAGREVIVSIDEEEEVEAARDTSTSDQLEGTNYYIILVSARELKVAQEFKEKGKKDFGNAYILEQPNKFFRVGIYAGENYQEAKATLNKAKLLGYSPVWISYE